MTPLHPAVQLWREHHCVAPYPAGCEPVPGAIPGTAFFPGGYGLWRLKSAGPLPPWPHRGVMVLGHDFHSVAGYQTSVARGRESPTQPTWRVLLAVLREASIEPAACFFTNVYMGLRSGSATTGRFPGSADTGFVSRCQTFLLRQLAAQEPTAILTLGLPAMRFLAAVLPALSAWHRARTFAELDELGPVQQLAATPGVGTLRIGALVHPSFRHAVVRTRRYRGLRGHLAELQLIRDTTGRCSLTSASS